MIENIIYKDKVIDEREFGFYIISNAIVDDERLNAYDMAVYNVLARCANRESKSCYPSMATICKKTGIKSRNTVKKSINHLVELGYLRVEQRKMPDGDFMSNIYYLLNPPSANEEHSPSNSEEGTSYSEEGVPHIVRESSSSNALKLNIYNNTKYNKSIKAKAFMASPKEENDMLKQNGLFQNVPVREKSKRITWKNVVELFLEKHNEMMRSPIERESDKKVLNNHLASWFREKGINQEQAYKIVPHFMMYFSAFDNHNKNDEKLKPIWFHPEHREKMSFKLDKGLEHALKKLSEPQQTTITKINTFEVPDDEDLDALFEN